MKEFIEKLIGRLEEEKKGHLNLYCDGLTKAISIVNQLAEEYKSFGNSEQVNGKDTNVRSNADRIRAMSDEELAEFFISFKNTFGEEYEGKMSCLDWLQSEAEEA